MGRKGRKYRTPMMRDIAILEFAIPGERKTGIIYKVSLSLDQFKEHFQKLSDWGLMERGVEKKGREKVEIYQTTEKGKDYLKEVYGLRYRFYGEEQYKEKLTALEGGEKEGELEEKLPFVIEGKEGQIRELRDDIFEREWKNLYGRLKVGINIGSGYRRKEEMMGDILWAVKEGATTKYKIIMKAMMGYIPLTNYLNDLIQIGFLEQNEDGISISKMGNLYLEVYKREYAPHLALLVKESKEFLKARKRLQEMIELE